MALESKKTKKKAAKKRAMTDDMPAGAPLAPETDMATTKPDRAASQPGEDLIAPPPEPPAVTVSALAEDQPAAGPSETASPAPVPDPDPVPDPAARRAKKARKAARRAADTEPTALTEEEAKPLGTAKAVETMFRNAIRAQLDLIQLAAMKANIMISLNGFIISALMISGALMFTSSRSFLLPAEIFMATAAASIIFALLSASPQHADRFGAFWRWAGAVWRGQARLRDLRTHLTEAETRGRRDQTNLLIYEDCAGMTAAEYWQRMQDLMRDRDDVYHQMSDQLYWLSQQAERKFRLLNISYTLFRWGLLVSVLAFFAMKSLDRLFLPSAGDGRAASSQAAGAPTLTGVYEPSGVVQLPDGQVLVVEDEATRALALMSLAKDGTLATDPARNLALMRRFGRKLNDLEALTIDPAGHVYALTSHSLNSKGARSPDREQLLRFEVSSGTAGGILAAAGLRDAITGSPDLAAAIEAAGGEPVDLEALNIEGLAFDHQGGRLLLGLREPLAAGRSILLPIDNPDALFEDQAAPRFGAPILLDLQGGGIRAISHDPINGGYLIANEIIGLGGKLQSTLWRWSGASNAAPVALDLPEIAGLKNVEAITFVRLGDDTALLVMCDEGDAKAGTPARYLLIEAARLAG